MKISINQAEHIISRIDSIYKNDTTTLFALVSEFDDPEYTISSKFKEWASEFTTKEQLLEHSLIIKNTVDEQHYKQKINTDINTLNKINTELEIFKKLSTLPPITRKNKILGQLTKRGKNEQDMATISSSIFSEDSIKKFKKHLQLLITQKNILLENINNKKNKKIVELSNETVVLLQRESLILGDTEND